jgi:cyclopropane-fatty-acyl-phospholipid synthase
MQKTIPVTGGASAEALEHHYDIGNDFYQLWLDEQFLSYTCALWEDENNTLEAAQLRKVVYHCQQVGLEKGQRVLDVGCGWGGLLKYLVETYNLERAVGLTLNQPHLDCIATYHNPRIEARLENWAAHSPGEPYDVVFAWGVMEHAARPDLSPAEKVEAYRLFFRCCHSWLKPGGWLSLQTIAYGNMRREDMSHFFITEIFPESDLPNLADIAESSARLFEIVTLRNDREDYVRTCREWLSRLRANRAAAVNLVGEEVVTRYEKYLKLSIIGFHVGTTNLYRLTLRRLET